MRAQFQEAKALDNALKCLREKNYYRLQKESS